MSKILYIFTTVLCIIFASGCNTLQAPLFIDVEGFDVESHSDSVYINSDIIIYNPNWHKLEVSKFMYSVFLDTIHLGEGVFKDELTLPSKDSTIISTRFLLNNFELENFVNLSDSALLTVKCSTLIPIVNSTYSFEYEIELFQHLEKLINHSLIKENFEIKNINLNSISLTDIQVDFDVEVSNNNHLNYTIDSLSFVMFKSKKLKNKIGQTSISDSFIVEKDSLNQFNVSMQLNSLMMASSLFFKTIDQDIYYYVKITGILVFNGIAVPIDLIKKVEIDLSTMKLKLGK
jgi:LEA14-like dessication related protein